MPYQFATDRPDYSDLASGRVLYNLPGHPAFPIRLADEIVQRCLAVRKENHLKEPCTLFDPCCGGAYLLSVLGYLHWGAYREIIASDVDQDSIHTAQKNLGLLSRVGMEQRINELKEMCRLYGKKSHQDALESAYRLQQKINIQTRDHLVQTRAFQANALDKKQLQGALNNVGIDIVFADVPYGHHSQWQRPISGTESSPPLWQMLNSFLGILLPTSLVAVAFDKSQKATHEGYHRLDQFQVGKRRIAILRPKI